MLLINIPKLLRRSIEEKKNIVIVASKLISSLKVK
jgi:hypothetical protein